MDRRAFISVVGWKHIHRAAPDSSTGWKGSSDWLLAPGTATTNAGLRKAFSDGRRDHGWIEEQNITTEYRWAGDEEPTLNALAAELARLPLKLIFAINTPAALAMKRTGTTLPVVFAQVSEPTAIGLVASLARPSRNFTGLTTINRSLLSLGPETLGQKRGPQLSQQSRVLSSRQQRSVATWAVLVSAFYERVLNGTFGAAREIGKDLMDLVGARGAKRPLARATGRRRSRTRERGRPARRSA